MNHSDIIIKSIEKDKTKYKVITNQKEFKLSEDTIIKYLIVKDKIFSKSEFDDILNFEETNSLFNKVLKFLSFQYRSTKEIIDYLTEKEASNEQVDEIISKLHSLKYLNDETFAIDTLDYMIRNQKGPKALENKLRLKGIDEKLINQTLEKYTYEIEKEVVDSIINKLLLKNTDLPVKKQKFNIYQKLLRDGFNTDLVNEEVNHLQFVDVSFESLEKEFNKLMEKYLEISESERKNKIISKLMMKGYEYTNILSMFHK